MIERKQGDSSIFKDILVFILLCGMVFGLAFVLIPQKELALKKKPDASISQGEDGVSPQSSLPKDEQERLKQDISVIGKQIAAKDKQGADTFAPQYVHMAGIYETLGLLPQARNAYLRAIEQDKKSKDAFIGLGNVYVAEKRYNEAEAVYKAVISLDEKYVHGYIVLANFYFTVIKDEDRARTTYLRGLLSTNNDTSLARAYANFLETVGRNYEAYLYWSEAAKGNPDDLDARKRMELLKPSVEDAIRATEEGGKKVVK